MTAIAVLLIVTLIGFLIAIGSIIAVAIGFRKLPQRLSAAAKPPMDSAVEVFNTGRGIYETGKIRYDGYVKHGTRIVNSVKTTSEQMGSAAKSVDVNGAKSSIKQAAATINAAQESLSAARAIIEILSRAQDDK